MFNLTSCHDDVDTQAAIVCGSLSGNFRVHYGTFNSPSGLFGSFDEALLALESICKEIQRMCERKGCSCLLHGVVSVSEKDTTKRTRYGTIYDPSNEVSPHIHVTYLIEKYSKMTRDIRKYLKNRFGQKYFFQPIKDPEYLKNRIHYCVSQCMNYRVVNTCTEPFAMRYAGDFVYLTEKENKAWGNGKLVFPEYVEMTLGSDDSVYDFSLEYAENDVEVLTDIGINQTVSPRLNDLEDTSLLAENVAKQGDFSTISTFPTSWYPQ